AGAHWSGGAVAGAGVQHPGRAQRLERPVGGGGAAEVVAGDVADEVHGAWRAVVEPDRAVGPDGHGRHVGDGLGLGVVQGGHGRAGGAVGVGGEVAGGRGGGGGEVDGDGGDPGGGD